MTKVLILGGGGMLGHKLFQVLRPRCDVYATFRHYDEALRTTGIFDEARVIGGVDAWDIASVQGALARVRPDWVVNCIGLIRQLGGPPKAYIYLNGLFPHLVCDAARDAGARVIHVSTDCVFSGRRGDYTEDDGSDAEEMYGKTKFLGEVAHDHALTLRTSIIGRDLTKRVSLMDWFLSQSGKTVQGYSRVIYTGLSTLVLSREICRVITEFPHLHGLYHVSSDKISKHDLLVLANRLFGADVAITPSTDLVIDRSLISTRYRRETGFTPPAWEAMLAEIAADPTPYGRTPHAST